MFWGLNGSKPWDRWQQPHPELPVRSVGGLQHHSLAVTASEPFQTPLCESWQPGLMPSQIAWALIPCFCDPELRDVVTNPARTAEGAAPFICCANAIAELWFLWNSSCAGGGRAEPPWEVLSSAFAAISDRLGSRQLNNQDFFYGLGSKPPVLSSCFAQCW